jgi:mRNA interferase HicA
MNARQFLRDLRKEAKIDAFPKKGTGHWVLVNRQNGMVSELPMHGGGKQLGTGLMRAIRKQLGLK